MLVPVVGSAQGLVVTGRVVRVGTIDSVPVTGRMVTLHEVGLSGGRPVDSALTTKSGTYRLRTSRQDSTASYLTSVQHDGIGYFSAPLRGRAGTDTVGTLFVYDTSSVRPDIVLTERHLIVRSAEDDGSRRVIELIVLRNQGSLTRIASDTSDPVWQGAIPAEAIQFELGESDLSAQAVYRRGDSVAVAAPMTPGEKQVIYGYLIPVSVRNLSFPLDHSVGRLNLLIEDQTASVSGSGLVLLGVEELDNRFYRRFGADTVSSGSRVEVRFAPARLSANSLWWLVIAVAGLTLIGVLIWWIMHSPEAPAPPPDARALATQIAGLDAEFEQQPGTAAEQAGYRKRRAELKISLNRALSSHRRLD